MPTTTNFGWTTPADTDLVKDGASAIRTLGNGIDTSFLDLKGGTTGQVLSKASNTDLDFTWVTENDADAIQNSIVDAKGDLISATAADTPARLAVGTDGQVLTADSTTATGLKWATTSSGAMVLISRTSFSNVASQAFDNVFTSTYKVYIAHIERIYAATATDDLYFRWRYGSTTRTTGYYGASGYAYYNSNTVGSISTSNAAQMIISASTGGTGGLGAGHINFYKVGVSGESPTITGQFWDDPGGYAMHFGCNIYETTQNYNGFILSSSSSNITGTVSIYGLAIA